MTCDRVWLVVSIACQMVYKERVIAQVMFWDGLVLVSGRGSQLVEVE